MDRTALTAQFNFGLLGFAFLLNRDVALSVWLFFLLANVERGVFAFFEIRSEETLSRFANLAGPYLAHQAMGAMIVLVLSGLRAGRGHLRQVVSKACGRGGGPGSRLAGIAGFPEEPVGKGDAESRQEPGGLSGKGAGNHLFSGPGRSGTPGPGTCLTLFRGEAYNQPAFPSCLLPPQRARAHIRPTQKRKANRMAKQFSVRAVRCDHRASDEEVYQALARATSPLTRSWQKLEKAGRIALKFNMMHTRVEHFEGRRRELVDDAVARAVLRLLRERTSADLVASDTHGYDADGKRTDGLNYLELLQEFGVEYDESTLAPFAEYDVPGGGFMFDRYTLSSCWRDADEVVSVAKMKNHGFMGVTLCMKNLFGITPTIPPEGRVRTYFHHAIRLSYVLPDLGRITDPALNVIDATTGQWGCEWGGGRPRRQRPGGRRPDRRHRCRRRPPDGARPRDRTGRRRRSAATATTCWWRPREASAPSTSTPSISRARWRRR